MVELLLTLCAQRGYFHKNYFVGWGSSVASTLQLKNSEKVNYVNLKHVER